MTHEIKLLEEFCKPVAGGAKTFEIRLNDRNYLIGDYIKFIPWSKKGNKESKEFQYLKKNIYEITYVLSGFGLQDGYVAFSIEPSF